MKILYKLVLLFTTLCLLTTACEENDNFSTDPNLQLEYPEGLIYLDTVFTSVASPYVGLKIYNRNNKSISFSSIELLNGSGSSFRIVIDGQSGTMFNNVDLLKKDSMYVFIDMKANEINTPSLNILEKIHFQWNGNTKDIELGAHVLNTEVWEDKLIDTDMTITADKVRYIKGNVTIKEGVTLNIKEGSAFYFDTKGAITINGTVVAEGSIKRPITFRGHRFDFVEQNIPYDNAVNQWLGITVGENSFENSFRNVRIRNSKIGLSFEKSTPTRKKAILENTVIHNTTQYGLRAINCNIDVVNCLITNSKGKLVNLCGGEYLFLHSTIANYFQWSIKTADAVTLEDRYDGINYPLLDCNFINSIIYGSFSTELIVTADETKGSDYLFANCIIKGIETPSSKYVNIIWNKFPLFYDLNGQKRFFYNFKLLEGSPAIDNAEPTFSQYAPLDIRGVSRMADSGPDIGCYEWTPTK